MKTIIKGTELLFNGLVEQVVHIERDKLCSEACRANDVIYTLSTALNVAATYVFCSHW